jgi:hypothetical protein
LFHRGRRHVPVMPVAMVVLTLTPMVVPVVLTLMVVLRRVRVPAADDTRGPSNKRPSGTLASSGDG